MRRQRWFLAIGMVVALSSTADAALRHRYSFTSDASDSVGGANGTVVDPGAATAVFAGGKLDLSANVGNGSNNIVEDAFVDLPNGIVTAATNGGTAGQLTVEIWAQSAENRNWAASVLRRHQQRRRRRFARRQQRRLHPGDSAERPERTDPHDDPSYGRRCGRFGRFRFRDVDGSDDPRRVDLRPKRRAAWHGVVVRRRVVHRFEPDCRRISISPR